MIRLREHLVYELEQDLFTARVRGPHPELVVNYGYEGVVALNCVRRQQHPVLPFPSDDFSIYSWVMSPAGDVSYVFSGDAAEGALLVDHERETTTALQLPSGLPPISDLAWFSSGSGAPVVLDYEGGLWAIEGISLRRASATRAEECMNYFWRRVLSHYTVVKGDPYGRGVYVRSREFVRKTIGFMPLDANQAPLLMAQDGAAVDTTRLGDTLFVSDESEVVVYENDTTRQVLAARDEEIIVRINAVEHEGIGYLTVVSSAEDHLNPARGRVTSYEILRS